MSPRGAHRVVDLAAELFQTDEKLKDLALEYQISIGALSELRKGTYRIRSQVSGWEKSYPELKDLADKVERELLVRRTECDYLEKLLGSLRSIIDREEKETRTIEEQATIIMKDRRESEEMRKRMREEELQRIQD